MTRPKLHRIPLAEVLPIGSRPGLILTMSRGQWDALLAASYEAGDILLELDPRERPIAAYQKPGVQEGRAS